MTVAQISMMIARRRARDHNQTMRAIAATRPIAAAYAAKRRKAK